MVHIKSKIISSAAMLLFCILVKYRKRESTGPRVHKSSPCFVPCPLLPDSKTVVFPLSNMHIRALCGLRHSWPSTHDQIDLINYAFRLMGIQLFAWLESENFICYLLSDKCRLLIKSGGKFVCLDEQYIDVWRLDTGYHVYCINHV